MTKTPDLTAMFKDVMGSFPVDTSAMDGAFKSTTAAERKTVGSCSDTPLKNPLQFPANGHKTHWQNWPTCPKPKLSQQTTQKQ